MNINEIKEKYEKVIEHLKTELSGIRTNRVLPSVIENVKVTAYEGSGDQVLKELAAITSPEARQLLVEPWDKSIIKQIEKALDNTEFGFSVSNEGSQIRLVLPIMTDEVRTRVKKLLHEKLEVTRIALRKQRELGKDEINKAEKKGEISEDDKFEQIKKIDEITKEYTDEVTVQGDLKEGEISS